MPEIKVPTESFEGEVLLYTLVDETRDWCLKFFLPYARKEAEAAKVKVLFVVNNSGGKFIREMEDLCRSTDYLDMEYAGRFSTPWDTITACRNYATSVFDSHRFSHLFSVDVDNPGSKKPTTKPEKFTHVPKAYVPEFLAAFEDLNRRGYRVGAVGGRYHMRGRMTDEKQGLPMNLPYSTVRIDLKDPEVKRLAQDRTFPYVPVLGLPFGFTMFPREVAPLMEIPPPGKDGKYLGTYGTEDFPVMDAIRDTGYSIFLVKASWAWHLVRHPETKLIGAY